MNDILKRLSTVEMENKELKRQINKLSNNGEGFKNKPTSTTEIKINENEIVNGRRSRRSGEASTSIRNIDEEEDYIPLINRLQIIQYSKRVEGVANEKILNRNDGKNPTPSSMVRKIKLKSRKKSSKALLSITTKETTTKVSCI